MYQLFSKVMTKLLFVGVFLVLGVLAAPAQAADGITGDWDIKISLGDREIDSTLRIVKNDSGQLAGTWTSRRGESELSDVKFKAGELTFKLARSSGERSFTMEFKGRLEGDALKGEFTTSRGTRKAIGKRAGEQASGIDPSKQVAADLSRPSRTEVITPIRNETFNRNGTTKERKQGGNPRMVAGYLAFDGSMDGNRQVDPQIAVGGDYVLHGTNSGIIIYDKAGSFVQGVPQSGFNGGIDPKLFFDPHNRVFGFDLWNPWDKDKKKPVNISVSETSDPKGAWNTYAVPAPGGRDGGGIGYSKTWIGYTFPGGKEQTFVIKMAEAKAGKPATVYHFAGNLGHPVATQDDIDDLYFFKLSNSDFTLKRITDSGDGSPKLVEVATKAHGLKYVGWPPQSPQKDSTQKTASGDRNPKNLVIQNGYLWFSQTVNCEGRAAVQWHQLELDATIVQTGLIRDPKSSYIQTTIAVNKHMDVLVGFQETSPDMFISPRLAFRRASDPPGQLSAIVKLGEGQDATDGVSWGDYSGSVVDGDNLTDLWTIQSITDKGGKGDTIIVKVPFQH
jgi:hypothetical protein